MKSNNFNINNTKFNKSKTCCFTGYRPQKCPWGFNEKDKRCLIVKKITNQTIIDAINNGFNTFITGMALGFDMICAEIVLKLKKKYKNIKIFAALPCENQDKLWNKKQKLRYKKILKKIDKIIYTSTEYSGAECMIKRNHFMVENSSMIIALFDGKSGGTEKTVKYAKKQGLDIVIINP